MNGDLAKITCPHCGFVDYATDQEWDKAGVWAFKWWNGTNSGKTCSCPKCGGEIWGTGRKMAARLESGNFGIIVVRDEKEIKEETQVVSDVQGTQDGEVQSVEAEGAS